MGEGDEARTDEGKAWVSRNANNGGMRGGTIHDLLVIDAAVRPTAEEKHMKKLKRVALAVGFFALVASAFAGEDGGFALGVKIDTMKGCSWLALL
jgi:hypothetical protein